MFRRWRPFTITFRTELNQVNKSIFRFIKKNAIFRIIDDINYLRKEKKIKAGWKIADSKDLLEQRLLNKSMVYGLAKDVTEYEILLNKEPLYLYELLAMKLLQNYEGEEPDGD